MYWPAATMSGSMSPNLEVSMVGVRPPQLPERVSLPRPSLLTKPRHVIERGPFGLMGRPEKAGSFGWGPIDAFVFIPQNLSLASVLIKPVVTFKDIDLRLSIGSVDYFDAFCMGPHRQVSSHTQLAASFISGQTCDVAYWQCAPKARITSGGRFHPESCRLIW